MQLKDLPKTGGIYKITNTANGVVYIGESKNMYLRMSCHFSDLKRGKGVNKHLQRDYDIYGRDVFVFEIVEHQEDSHKRFLKEQSLITKSEVPLYNVMDNPNIIYTGKIKKNPRHSIDSFYF